MSFLLLLLAPYHIGFQSFSCEICNMHCGSESEEIGIWKQNILKMPLKANMTSGQSLQRSFCHCVPPESRSYLNRDNLLLNYDISKRSNSPTRKSFEEQFGTQQ